jgi:hypothetical protein
MLAGEEKQAKSLEELLAEAAPDATAALRSLVSFSSETEVRAAEVRLAAAKFLLETWARVKEANVKHPIGVPTGNGSVATNRMATPATATATPDQVLSEIMGGDHDSALGLADDEETANANGSAKAAVKAPAKSKPAPAKAAPAKTPPAPAKPKAKFDPDAISALRRVPVKHWATLGVLALVFGATWLFSLFGGPPTVAELLTSALKAGDPDVRGRAVAALCVHKDPKTPAALRQLVAESQDASAKQLALQSLADRSNSESLPLFLDAMESPEKSLRILGYASYRKLLGITEQNDLGYDPEGPLERCAAAVRPIRDQRNKDLAEAASTARTGTPSY